MPDKDIFMRRIDSFPTNHIQGLDYRVGRVFPFGATVTENGGVNFSVFSRGAQSCTLVLYHQGEKEPFVEIPFPRKFRTGDVYTMMVFGLDIETTEYGYRMDGEYAPEKGMYYDKNKVLLDPYARCISGRPVWGVEPEEDETFPHRGKILFTDYDWQGDQPLRIPQKDLVIYELHVRSFTRHESSQDHYNGTFAGLREKIPYLKKLGINCVELMPVFAFDEAENDRVFGSTRLVNYWGYSTVGFFAPKAGYAESGEYGMEADELKAMIRELHQEGIEVILDVVFNHTAEGDQRGPTISFRGIDNQTYYLMTPEGEYYNFSGCGNTMNCNNAVVRGFILDCLRYWVSDYHIDGFRFDLASILTRDQEGEPMLSPPLLETLANDPVLGKCKLIAEAWDAGGLYQVGSFPSWNRFSEWNGKYRDCVRRFVKGDAGSAPELFLRIAGSPDLYGVRLPESSINFVTCHDGFTMYDLVSYNEKHNEANGEENRDGSNDNLSWNCGAEGDTEDPEILSLRIRQMKNFYTLLLMSRGVPMLLSGDEFANTQHGNNNAYCQDNEISWLNWEGLEKNRDLFDYVQRLIALRKEHPVIRAEYFDSAHNGTGYPELSFHGLQPWEIDVNAPALCFGFMYAEDHKKYKTAADEFIYVAVNAHWESHEYRLPILPEHMFWKIEADSSLGDLPEDEAAEQKQRDYIWLGPRSMVVLTGKKRNGI